ncbi:hypothetical protein [Demequina zhanjiangensis]|uniref:Uncharacterized protein n=1 Tax=Demequina zhanjiangensis TaxID=3051659 RepID=A0ABT8FXU1_9MICO|nr:hypothetical protein [Demequina sp. SYSU T00b26]MDN4471504.1 hypothetical protein [Demequina sp. SYSU T00b26]
MTHRTAAVDSGEHRPFDTARAWLRPALFALVVAASVSAIALVQPVLALVLLTLVGLLVARLHGSGLEPWRPHPVDRFPNTVSDARLRRFAADLRWRWEHGMVVGGLGRYADDGEYVGPVLTAVSQHGDAIVAHATLTPGTQLHEVDARTDRLAAGLEAAEASVLGGEQGTVALLVRERQTGEGWT